MKHGPIRRRHESSFSPRGCDAASLSHDAATGRGSRGSPAAALIGGIQNEGSPGIRGSVPRFSIENYVRFEGAVAIGRSARSHKTESLSHEPRRGSDHSDRHCQRRFSRVPQRASVVDPRAALRGVSDRQGPSRTARSHRARTTAADPPCSLGTAATQIEGRERPMHFVLTSWCSPPSSGVGSMQIGRALRHWAQHRYPSPMRCPSFGATCGAIASRPGGIPRGAPRGIRGAPHPGRIDRSRYPPQ